MKITTEISFIFHNFFFFAILINLINKSFFLTKNLHQISIHFLFAPHLVFF